MRYVLIADAHLTFHRPERLPEELDRLAAAGDLLVFLGDIFSHEGPFNQTGQYFSFLGRLGDMIDDGELVYVLGNHDDFFHLRENGVRTVPSYDTGEAVLTHGDEFDIGRIFYGKRSAVFNRIKHGSLNGGLSPSLSMYRSIFTLEHALEGTFPGLAERMGQALLRAKRISPGRYTVMGHFHTEYRTDRYAVLGKYPRAYVLEGKKIGVLRSV